MNTPMGVEHCFNFINCQLQPPTGTKPLRELAGPKRAVTLSRQSGCGAHLVAETLANYLQSHALPEAPPWTVVP